MDIVSLGLPSGANRPGAGSFIYVAEIDWVATWGAFATNTNYGDELRITGDHTFDTGKGFVRWDTIDDVFEVNAPVVGTQGALALKPMMNLYIPGITAAKVLAAQENKNYVVLAPIFGCASTTFLQIGDSCNPVRMMPSDGMKTGKSRSNDQRGMLLTLEGYGTPYFYEGDVNLYP